MKSNHEGNTVQPPVNDHPKCKGVVFAYGRWSLTRNGRYERVVVVYKLGKFTSVNIP